ncbi:MAG: MBOAT family protein [Bacteroidia bacterium]|nr:MBOAT family protein [Bacteroidota bacterium]MBP9082210.1 MBOAT family protein [Bacteroidia bacterium]
MLFNSFEFLIFFITVTSLYFSIQHRFRWALLLASSCIFYMFFIPEYILILFVTIIIDYFAGILIENAKGNQRKKYLLLSLIANIGVLAIFKYYNFLNDNISELCFWIDRENPIPYLNIILPIGLSFHTFQAMSYTIEVYRGHQPAERHFGIYSLYVMFYPQLVAGPIERPQNLLHQFRTRHVFEYNRVVSGLKLMTWGLFKKAVIADRLAIMADSVFNNPDEHYGFAVILGAVFFAFQIYCDFSGYSDMAIGAARVMGFHLMTNFNSPYFAKSISEFWKRWHISLSTWFKDYLYVPLGGNRVGKWKWYYNLMITFMISGLWHGANWTFIIWGALHGFYLVFALITANFRNKLFNASGLQFNKTLAHLLQSLTVFVLVTFAWIFFRADSLDVAITLIRNATVIDNAQLSITMFTENYLEFILGLALIPLLLFAEWIYHVNPAIISDKPKVIRYAFYLIAVLIIVNLGVFGGNNFIYFQF